MTKNLKKLKAEKICLYFLDQKLQFTYPHASIKDAQATGEAFRPQKRTSSNSKDEIPLPFSFFCGSFLPSWIRIQQLKLMRNPASRFMLDGTTRTILTQKNTTAI
jgi:hypothetical protein